MRETIRSLRIYFFISGAVSVFVNLEPALAAGNAFQYRALAAYGVAAGLSLLAAGFIARTAISEKSERLLRILYFGMGYVLANLAATVLIVGASAGAIRLVLPLLVLLYLRSNVIRLSTESYASADPVAA